MSLYKITKDKYIQEGFLSDVGEGLKIILAINIAFFALILVSGYSSVIFQKNLKKNPKFKQEFKGCISKIINFLKKNEPEKYSKYISYKSDYDAILKEDNTRASKNKKDNVVRCYPSTININKLVKDLTGKDIGSRFEKDSDGEYNPDDYIELDTLPEVDKVIDELRKHYKSLNSKINKYINNNAITIDIETFDDTIFPGCEYSIIVSFIVKEVSINRLSQKDKEKVNKLASEIK